MVLLVAASRTTSLASSGSTLTRFSAATLSCTPVALSRWAWLAMAKRLVTSVSAEDTLTRSSTKSSVYRPRTTVAVGDEAEVPGGIAGRVAEPTLLGVFQAGVEGISTGGMEAS